MLIPSRYLQGDDGAGVLRSPACSLHLWEAVVVKKMRRDK